MKQDRSPRGLTKEVRPRQLALEVLEERQVLDGTAPWHNPDLPMDVDNNSSITPHDVLLIVNRLLLTGIGPLDPPSGTPENYYDTSGDNMLSPLDALLAVNALLRPTEITLDTYMPYSIDLTPRLVVSASGAESVPDGTPVHLDVDLNNDGRFTGNEIDYTVSSMYRNRSEFALGPALPADGPSGPYTINLRARVENSLGVLYGSGSKPLVVDTQTSDALANYVNTPDDSYTWSQVYESAGPGYTYYVLQMTSQTWRPGDVSNPVWNHWMRVVVPDGAINTTSLLLISGGSNTSSMPTSFDPQNNPEDAAFLGVAMADGAVATELKVVPNEPISFLAENPPQSRTEDQIIAYTLDQYMRHIGEPGNETWPLLLPMVKSAVRGMDTIQAFVNDVSGGAYHVDDFVVSGYSKRGWTTWLTGAIDSRVRAIIPGVFDNPNQGPQMVHHYEVYGFFSEEVKDYTDLHIFDRFWTPEAEQLSKIIDPYRYFRNGRFANMPVLSLDSAGDEFFVSDSSQFYFADLPGPVNRLRYFPNTGHGLDYGAVQSTVSFFDAVVNNRQIPNVTWTVEPNGSIHAHTDGSPTQVLLWQATNPDARDFRHGFHPDITWTSSPATGLGGGDYVASLPTPATGATAFFLEFTFPSGVAGAPFVFTTDIRVNSDLPLTPWPFSSSAAPNVSVSDNPGTTALVTSSAVSGGGGPEITLFVLPGTVGVNSAQPVPSNVLPAATIKDSTAVAVAAVLADSTAYSDSTDDVELSASDDGGSDAVDAVLDDYLDEVFS